MEVSFLSFSKKFLFLDQEYSISSGYEHNSMLSTVATLLCRCTMYLRSTLLVEVKNFHWTLCYETAMACNKITNKSMVKNVHAVSKEK